MMTQETPRISLETIPGMVLLADCNGIIKHANQKYIEHTGFEWPEIEGTLLTTLWSNPRATIADILHHLEKNADWQDAIVHRKKDGTFFREACAISKVPSPDKSSYYLLKVAHSLDSYDFNALSLTDPPSTPTRLDANIPSTENEYRSIVAVSPNPMVVTRRYDGRCLMANEAFCQKSGYAEKDILGKTIATLGLHKDKSAVRTLYKELNHKGLVENIEHELVTCSGRIIATLLSSRLIRFGGEACYLFVWTDISDQRRALEELKESEEGYRNIYKLSPIAITINRTSDARYVEVNDTWSQRTGFKREEVIGHLSTELHVYQDLNVRDKLWEQFKAQGYVDDLELAFTNRYGERLYSLVSARRIRFKGEDCLLYISTRIDNLKMTQKALAEREENYRTILDLAPYSITLSKVSDGTYLQVNKAFVQKFGFSAEEALGRTSTDLNIYIDPADRGRLIEIILRDGRVDSLEVKLRNKNGQITENLVSMTTFQFQGVECIISMTVDISSLKETQRALEESETRFRTIFETAADPIFLNDLVSGRFIDVNEAACRHLGYDKAEFLKMSLDQVHPDHSPDPLSDSISPSIGKAGMFFESLHLRKNGSEAFVEISSQQVMLRENPVLLSIIRDITQRKQTETELANYRKNLEQMVAERTKALKLAQDELIKKEKLAVLGQLTATVSHELRNPLGVIRSSNFYLQRKVKERNQKLDKHFSRIDEQVSLCDAIVNELLEFTRGRSATIATQNMVPWITQVVEQICEQERVKIKLEIDKNMPPIAHDKEKMRRVLVNLLQNAVHAVREKAEDFSKKETYTPEIKTCVTRKENTLNLTVSDNGTGMDESTRQKAFEPLFTTKSRGTGIGLAIVKQIIEDHQGDIRIESRPDEGTRITVTLPYAPSTS